MRFIRIIVAFCLASMMTFLTSCSGETEKKEEKAKYIFLFIGDGMGFNHVMAVESYLSYKAGKVGGERLTMTQFPYSGVVTTYSANNNVTDSSAAGTAIAGGEKTNNHYLGVNAMEEPVTTIANTLKQEGYNIGITSSVAVNHATPAAFYAHSTDRYNYYGIGQQLAESGFEFFAGSGFLDYFNKDGENIEDYLKGKEYPIYYGIDEYRNSAGADSCSRVILCHQSNRGGIADNYESSSKIPGDDYLNDVLRTGIEFLGEEEPFFIMCEGGKIDWVAHANKVMPLITEIIEFDDAIAAALDFYRKHPDETLIVVTADHETGGISLGSRKSHVYWEVVDDQWIKDGFQNNLSKEENERLNYRASIGWTSEEHTGGSVPIYAIGKGAERFTGQMDNTDIKGKILCE